MSNHNGDWECNDCGKDFTTNSAFERMGKLYCPQCGSGNLRMVM